MEFDPAPFVVCPPGEKPAKPRPVDTLEGLGDRMRTAAFAEYQAIAAFTWAAGFFQDVPQTLRDDWAAQVGEETRHYNLIRERMAELGVELTARPVTMALWDSLKDLTSGRDFCIRIASSEERGRQAGLRLCADLVDSDPTTAAVFRQIVDDEVAHVALAEKYFGWTPDAIGS